MSNLETLDVGQANELKLAFRRHGWTNEELKRLCEGNILAKVRSVQLGFSEIKPTSHIINCDAQPFTPDGLRVEEHQKGGQFVWSPDAVELYLVVGQEDEDVAGTQPRHFVGDVHKLAFQQRPLVRFQLGKRVVRVVERRAMLVDAFAYFPRQIKPAERGGPMLQPIHDAQALQVMVNT